MGKLTKPEMRAAEIVNGMIDSTIVGCPDLPHWAGVSRLNAKQIGEVHNVSETQAREAITFAVNAGWLDVTSRHGQRAAYWTPSAQAFTRRIREMQDALHRIADEAKSLRGAWPTLDGAITRSVETYCDEASATRFASVRMRERAEFDAMVRGMAEEARR